MDPASPRLGQDIATSMGGMPAPHMGRTRRANTDWFISQFDELRQSLAAMQAMMAKGGRGGPGSHSPGSPAGPPPAMQVRVYHCVFKCVRDLVHSYLYNPAG
jgi:hypothetical protein